MKKLAALILFLGVALTINAQDNWKSGSNEINIGIKPFRLGPTSIQYKTKVSNRNWMRIGLTDLGLLDGATGIRVGIEKQRNMIGRSRFIYGLEPGIEFDYDRIDNDFASYNVDLGFPIGAQIHLSKRLLLGFEARPHIDIYESYIEDDQPGRTTKFGGGLDFFNGLRTTLGYRF